MIQLTMFDDDADTKTNTVRARSLSAAARAKIARAAREVYRRERGATADAILDVLWNADRPLRRTEIAHALEREDTPFFRTLIEQMVEYGDVLKTAGRWPGGMPVYYYEAKRGDK